MGKEAYNVLTKFYYDAACVEEFDHKGYFPISELLTKECEEMEHLEAHDNDYDVVSKEAVLWELSHAPHRETAGHQMSVSIYARGRDCNLGQADEAGKMLSLQERLTFYHGSETCMENDDGHSCFMKRSVFMASITLTVLESQKVWRFSPEKSSVKLNGREFTLLEVLLCSVVSVRTGKNTINAFHTSMCVMNTQRRMGMFRRSKSGSCPQYMESFSCACV